MNINTYFTKDKKVKEIILNKLNSAESHVCVAVAWFTDQPLFSKLLELQKKGVAIEVIITKHEFNTNSSNNFNLINENGGFFSEVGNDESLMHMKFCVIDYNVVISGSANWSNRAFTSNNEEVTIVEGHPQRANDFIEEFDRLKDLSGKIKAVESELNLSQIYKVFDIIKALVSLEDSSGILKYTQRLKGDERLITIVNHLISSEFDQAMNEMSAFVSANSSLVDVTSIEKMRLQTQIKLLSLQVETLSVEKVECELLIDQFIRRSRIELNPLIGKILLLKKKIYEKLKNRGLVDSYFDELENEFRKTNEDFELESKKTFFTLDDLQQNSIKEMYREASKYCHPDSPKCIFENNIESSEIFSQLTQAYKQNDINRVQDILLNLRNGYTKKDHFMDNLEFLKARLLSLRQKYESVLMELKHLKESETYIIASSLDNWEEYFASQKIELQLELEKLNNDFVSK